MFGHFIDYLNDLYQLILPVWNYAPIQSTIINIHLGRAIIAILLGILGRPISRFLADKINTLLIDRLIRDKKTRQWLEDKTSIFLMIVILILALLILGFSRVVLLNIWHLTIFTIQDHKVILGNVVVSFILLFLGIGLSRYLSRRIVLVIPKRFRTDVSAEKALTAIFKYVLVVIVFLFALSVAGIPLTAFTVIGGAFALGVGLGSQNLVNNFLSGLILMMERPLKVGDIVELENRRGVVEEIGGRSTRIRTFENYRMVMPNSKLLENTVINWSLMDNYLRREINVGVAYGSPVRKVQSLLLQAVKEQVSVEKQPESFVIFTDFGDNALMFRCYFWVEISEGTGILLIESDIRFRIDELFRGAGIVIAYPQHDVHLDSLKPVELKIVNPSSDNSKEEKIR
jgi:small-conductance mechanosensitive channel